MSKQISTIKCHKCSLNNWNTAGRCRRCGAPLPAGSGKKALLLQFLNFKRTAIPVAAIVLALCIYGFNRYRKEALYAGTALVATTKAMEKSAPVNREFEAVKQLHRDFLSRIDRNMTDHTGEGFKENQTLAFSTMMQLNEQQNKYLNPAALNYFNTFCRLVEKYYDQLVQYNSDSAHLAEVRQRIREERNLVVNDLSLSPEDKSLKLSELWKENADESKFTSVSAGDIDKTVQSLRNLF
jgi:hypothetical protein